MVEPQPGQYGQYPPPNQYGQYGPGGYGGPPPGGGKGGSVGIVIAIVVVLLLIAGGIGVFALTQGGDDDPVASGEPTISASESTSDVPTVSEPTGITPSVPGDTALTATAGGNTGTPDTSLTEPPAFTGEFPSDQQYIDLAASFVNASKEGDCPGATALLQKAYAKSISEDYYCAGDAMDRLQNIAFENPVFTSFQTAGASVAFQSTDGGTATIFMSFSGDKHAFVDSVYI